MWGNRFEEKPSGRPKVFLIRLRTKFWDHLEYTLRDFSREYNYF